MSRDKITTLLDLGALILLAVGLGLLAAGTMLGEPAVAAGLGATVTGLVLLGGSRVIDWSGAPGKAPKPIRRWFGGES